MRAPVPNTGGLVQTDGEDRVAGMEEAEMAKDQPWEQRLVYNGNVNLKVKNSDTTNKNIAQVAKKYEGMVVQTGSWGTNIRVKSNYVQAAMAELKMLGKVTFESLNAEDVTGQFRDLNIRLENAELAGTRYLDLLAKAENVEAALKVEKELEQLNGEIDLEPISKLSNGNFVVFGRSASFSFLPRQPPVWAAKDALHIGQILEIPDAT